MTQPYPFTYTVDTQHANASAAKRLRSNASAVSDAPHQKSGGRFVTWCGAHPIQLFEGSRPWVGSYAN